MIRGQHINRSVGYRSAQCLDIRGGAQRRIHLGLGVVVIARGVGEQQVVRTCLAAHGLPRGARTAENFGTTGGRYMLRVVPGSNSPVEHDIALQHQLFRDRRPRAKSKLHLQGTSVHGGTVREAWLLAVLHERATNHLGHLQYAQHHLGVGDAVAIISERHGARLFHGSHGCQLFARAPNRCSSRNKYTRQVCLARPQAHELHKWPGIKARRGVRHAADTGEPAGNRCGCTSGDGFLVLSARLTQMHVRIDEPGTHHEAMAVDDFCSGSGQFSRLHADSRDTTADQQHVAGAVNSRVRANHSTSAQKGGAHRKRGYPELVAQRRRWMCLALPGVALPQVDTPQKHARPRLRRACGTFEQ